MKKTLILLSFLFIISCGNKEETKPETPTVIKTETVSDSKEKIEGAKLSFENYTRNGVLLNGPITLFDESLHQIGTLNVESITKVDILEKSTKMYNIEQSTDYCLKSNFVKVDYKGTKYLIFGTDVYEINEKETLPFVNTKNEKFSISPITSFKMGASDEEGLTGCEDFSYLLVFNHKTKEYSTITAPKDQENHSKQKYAHLLHDDGSEEKIYSIRAQNDSLILGIKVSFQDGYGSYFLKTSFKDHFNKSNVTNQNVFYEESRYNALK